MGFLDTLFDIAAPIVSAIVPGGGILAGLGRAAGLGSQPVARTAIASPLQIPSAALAATMPSLRAPAARQFIGAAQGVGGGGNGQVSVMTIVQTIDNATGAVVREKTLRGSPFLMNSDIAVAKRVFRTASKLGARLPKRIVKQSEASKLKDEIQDAAFSAIRNGAHHGGHHLVPACP